MIFDRIKHYLGLVRFSHTVFALPFAFVSAFVAAQGVPALRETWWILFCMVSARTSAMTFNRIVDRNIDRLNPRTKERHLPSGVISLREAMALWTLSSVLFMVGAYCLNFLAFILSPLTLLIINGYSLCKRFTSYSHLVLGLSLGIAPVGAWIGITGGIAWPPVILAGAVLLWVSGFDVIYALMDEEFDRKMGLHSLVVRLGKRKALGTAFVFHLLSAAMMFLFGWFAGMGAIYFIGTFFIAVLILYEHTLVKPDDFTRVNIAFFHVNAVISIGLFCFTFLDVLI